MGSNPSSLKSILLGDSTIHLVLTQCRRKPKKVLLSTYQPDNYMLNSAFLYMQVRAFGPVIQLYQTTRLPETTEETEES